MKFENNFNSLQQFECPDWFQNAKFGIWSHWGPQSVPMAGDWYARNMYIQGSQQYNYHVSHYGHPSQFGYIDICKLWKAENFNPEELMALYYKAGARYFVAQAMHHDNFFNYDSKLNRFNSKQIGPHKDICMLWKKAADQYNMPFGLTEHLEASYNWWYTNKGSDHYGPYKDIPYDGNKEEYRDFYHDNKEVTNDMIQNNKVGEFAPEWLTHNVKFQHYWKDCMIELIDRFQPELLYSDSALPFQREGDTNSNYQHGLDVISHLYNISIKKHGSNQAIYTQKDRKQDVYSVDRKRVV